MNSSAAFICLFILVLFGLHWLQQLNAPLCFPACWLVLHSDAASEQEVSVQKSSELPLNKSVFQKDETLKR